MPRTLRAVLASMSIALAAAATSAVVPDSAFAADALEPDVLVGVAHAGNVYTVTATLTAPVAIAIAWAVLTDFEHMTDFMPTLKASRVLQRHDNRVLIQQKGTMELGTFRLPFESDREIEMTPPGLIRSKQLRGNMQRVDSQTMLKEVGGGTRVDYRVEIVPKLWIPESVAGPLLKGEIERQFNAILREIMRRNGEPQ